ncbi:MAG: hypothetical protein K5905_26765, partial [Roseibium sp.]|uniref:calcium-binding protein n=1 Tax=Roseibium sp. TaxID=1936156 RepID=UPI002624A0A2
MSSDFTRGDGGYTFTEEQLAELKALQASVEAQYQQNEYQVGLAVPIYQKILEFISDGDGPKEGVTPEVWYWINGAADVNNQEGFFAAFIHEYTRIQYELRGGDPADFQGAQNEGQSASNDIGLKLLEDIIEYGNLPSIEGLGALDGGAAASSVFQNLPGHGGSEGDYAGWAGTLLFPFFGVNRFFDEWLLTDEAVPGTVEGQGEKIFKHSTGTYDLIAMMQASVQAAYEAALNEPFEAIMVAAFGPEGLVTDHTALIRELDNFFRSYYQLDEADGFNPSADFLLDPNALSTQDYWWDVGTHEDDILDREDGYPREIFQESFVVNAGDGDDFVSGGANSDLIDGDRGNDTLFGGEGRDFVFGGDGNDILLGGAKIGNLPTDPAGDLISSIDTTAYYDDEATDILNGGLGYDSYYIFSNERVMTDNTNWANASLEELRNNFDAFFPEAFYEPGDQLPGGAFADDYVYLDTSTFTKIDEIVDEDGSGEIFVSVPIVGSNFEEVVENPDIEVVIEYSIDGHQLVEFSNSRDFDTYSFDGTDIYLTRQMGDKNEMGQIAYYQEGADLYGFSVRWWAGIGEFDNQDLGAHWIALNAHFVIKDFQVGAFGIFIEDLANWAPGTDGNDTPDLSPGSNGEGATWNGLGGDDVATGTQEADWLRGEGGSDTLRGEAGNDYLEGGGDADTLDGGNGDDVLDGGDGADTLTGGEGNDTIYADRDDVWFSGDAGTDTLIYTDWNDFEYSLAQGGFENVSTDDGNDKIWGTSGDNEIRVEWGDDFVQAGDGNDIIFGGEGADTLQGQDGDDTIYADADDVWFSGDAGIDTLIYTSADDFEYALGQGAFENIYAGSGNNKVWGTDGDNEIYLEDGDDFVQAGDGNDIIDGGEGADTLQGQDGDDTIYADAEDAWFSGDAGIDTLIYTSSDDRQYSLNQGAFEHAKMGAGNNVVWGSSVDNTIDGEAGSDTLYGYDGADRLIGGAGADTLYGGSGSDTFVFRGGDTGHDI